MSAAATCVVILAIATAAAISVIWLAEKMGCGPSSNKSVNLHNDTHPKAMQHEEPPGTPAECLRVEEAEESYSIDLWEGRTGMGGQVGKPKNVETWLNASDAPPPPKLTTGIKNDPLTEHTSQTIPAVTLQATPSILTGFPSIHLESGPEESPHTVHFAPDTQDNERKLDNNDQSATTSGEGTEGSQASPAGGETSGGLREWGSMTGWRLIAQDVMKDVEEYGTVSKDRKDDAPQDTAVQDLASQSSLMRARIKSVVAKSGENFYMDYQLMEHIGSGAFGRAMKARRRTDGEVVVVKEVLVGRMSEKERAETKNEVKVLAHLSHPNVVKYYDFYSDGGKMHIVMEYCEEGDLSAYLKSKDTKHLEEDEIMMKFVQICLALQHIHTKGILHRDLKTQNIFLSSKGIVKLGDFGISKVLGADQAMARSMVGTPYYLSPEICEDKPYGPKSDVWSLGCVLYELCTLRHAFDGGSLPALVIKILSGKFPPIADVYSGNMKRLVEKLLCRNPDDRPTLDDLLKYDYVRIHVQRFASHIHYCVDRRRDSFKRSLQPFDLEETALGNLDTGSSTGSGSGSLRRTSTSQTGSGHIHGVHSTRSRSSSGSRRSRTSDLRSVSGDLPPIQEEGTAPVQRNVSRGWLEVEEGGDEEEDGELELSPYKHYSENMEVDCVALRPGRTTELMSQPETPLHREHLEAKRKLRLLREKLFLGCADAPVVLECIRTPSDEAGGATYNNPMVAGDDETGPVEQGGDVLEEGYGTDKERAGDESSDSEGEEAGVHSSGGSSMGSLQAAAPTVVAQMQQIFLEPATSTLHIGRISSSSEHECVEAPMSKEQEVALFKRKAFSMRRKAEEALGPDTLKATVSFLQKAHTTKDQECTQQSLAKIVGPDKLGDVKLVYKMLRAQHIYEHLAKEMGTDRGH